MENNIPMHIHKKCNLRSYKECIGYSNNYPVYLIKYKCLDHNIDNICRCGWEFGWHGGTNNKQMWADDVKNDAKFYRWLGGKKRKGIFFDNEEIARKEFSSLAL